MHFSWDIFGNLENAVHLKWFTDHWPKSLQGAQITAAWGGRDTAFRGELEIKKC